MKKIIIPSKRIGNEALKNWNVKDSTDDFKIHLEPLFNLSSVEGMKLVIESKSFSSNVCGVFHFLFIFKNQNSMNNAKKIIEENFNIQIEIL